MAVSKSQKLSFPGHSGASLAARLDLPSGPVRAYALVAHCFTCSKDLASVREMTAELVREGIAVFRFDFTGLGTSEGDFSATNFTSNVADLERAAEYMRDHFEAPHILIGHSLGGAAVLALGGELAEVKAVVSIGAPAHASHVLANIAPHIDAIQHAGASEVTLAGRKFTIEKQFVDDVRDQNILGLVAELRKPLLVLHAPLDQTVGIENAQQIFVAAKHPKSFISLDDADHLLSNPDDARYAGRAIAGWASHYLAPEDEQTEADDGKVSIAETGQGKFQVMARAGSHRLFADEPRAMGGLDSGPSPYDFLSIALGACTAMTLRLYAEHKGEPLGRVRVDVSHDKIHAKDCESCTDEERAGQRKIDVFSRVISYEGEVSEKLASRLADIADRCPVHRTLHHSAQIETVVAGADLDENTEENA